MDYDAIAQSVRPSIDYDGLADQIRGQQTNDAAPWYERFAKGAWSGAKDIATGTQQAMIEGVPTAIRMLANSPFSPPIVGPKVGNVLANAAQSSLAPTAEDLRRQVDWNNSVMSESGKNQSTPAGQVGAFVAKAIPAIAATAAAPEVFGAPVGAALLGGIQGATEPVGQNDNRAKNAATDAVLGYGLQKVGNFLGSAVSGVKPTANDLSRQQFLDWLQAQGAPATRYQMGGNPFVGLMERFGRKLPGSQDFYSGVDAAQVNAVNENAKNLTMNGMSGQGMTDLGNRVGGSIPVDAQQIADIRNLPSQFTNRAGKLVPKEAIQTANEFVGTPGAPGVPGGINPDFVIGGRKLSAYPPEQQANLIQQMGDAARLPGTPPTPGIAGTLQEGQQIPFSGANGYIGIRSDLGTEAYGAKTTGDREAWQSLQNAFDNGAYRALQQAGVDPQTLIKFRGAYSVDKLLSNAKVTLQDGSTVYDPAKLSRLISAKDSSSASYMDNLPDDIGSQLRDMANAGRFMQPVSSSHTAEMGVAGKVFTGEMLADLAREGPSAIAGPAGALYAMPKFVNMLLQGTRGGVPGLRNYPQVGTTLSNLVSGAGVQGANIFLPQVPGTLGGLLGM